MRRAASISVACPVRGFDRKDIWLGSAVLIHSERGTVARIKRDRTLKYESVVRKARGSGRWVDRIRLRCGANE